MATPTSAWAAFAPTPSELSYANQLFAVCDPQGIGILTGEAAVPVFAGSTLPPEILHTIWGIADHDNNGYLTKKGVVVAVRLIAWAQKGEPVTELLLSKPGPLPVIKGISTPPSTPAITRATSPSPRHPPPSVMPLLTPVDRSKYLKIFMSTGVGAGLLPGEKAREVFSRSRLPADRLRAIWNLADTRNRGSLDSTDFAIGMHLISACMSSPNFVVPSALPPGLYEQASGGKALASALEPQLTGASSSFGSPTRTSFAGLPAAAPIKTQYSGQQPSPLRPQATGTAQYTSPLNPQLTGSHRQGSSSISNAFPSTTVSSPFSNSITAPSSLPWDITPVEKAKSDGFFDTLDTQRRGFIEGDVAVPFMLDSQLPEPLLAQIWDLVDLNNDGNLTREGFAVALHLINGKLAGKEIPSTLPPSLVPPSMRKPSTAPGAFTPAPAAVPHSHITRDLWDIEDDFSSPNLRPAADPTPPKSPPFASAIPSMHTGAPGSSTGAPRALAFSPFDAPPVRSATDLLSDDEEPVRATPQSFASSSVAIANTKNQLDSTQASLTKAQADRARIEAAVTESAAQLAQLESQLASAKAQYQTETKLLKDMQTRQQEQMANIRSTREELIHAESELSGLRAEKAEIEGAVLRDKEDIRELQRKLREAHEQTNLAKAELEKLKKDARQQKGLLVIAKKQLASAEENAEKARKEAEVERLAIATANEDLAKTNSAIEELALKEPQAVSSAMAADPVALPASIPLPVTPEVLSAALSSKSNNPFGRLTQANSSTPSPTAFSSITLPAAASSAFEADHETASQTTREADPFNAAFGLDEPEQETPAFSSNLTPTVSKSLSQDILDSGAKESSRPPVSSGLDELATPKPETSTFVPFDAVEVENPTKLEAPQVDRPPTQYARHGDDSSDDEQEIEDAAPMRRLTPTITPDLSNGTLPAPLLFGEPVAEPAMTVMQPDAQGSSAANTTLAPKPSASFDDTSRFDEAVSATTPAAAEPTTPSSPKKSNSLFAALAPPPTKTGSVSRSPLSSVKRQSTGTSLFDDTAFVAQTSRFPPVSSSDTPPASSAELDDAFGTRTAINSAAANGSARPTAFEQSFEDSFDFGATPNLPLATAQLPAEVSALTATTTNGHSPAISTPFYTPHSSSAAANWPSSPVASIAANTQQPLYKPPSSPPPPASAFTFDDAFSTSAPRNGYSPPAGSPPVTAAPRFVSPQILARQSGPASPTLDEDEDRPLSQLTDRGRRSNSPPTLRSRLSISPPPQHAKASKIAKESDASGSKSSKLGLHFPFGKRNKKDKEQKAAGKKNVVGGEPESVVDERGAFVPRRGRSGLTPISQDVIGSAGPDDDIAAVKTLVVMGFTREQAIDALEQNSYDVPAALNKLLEAA